MIYVQVTKYTEIWAVCDIYGTASQPPPPPPPRMVYGGYTPPPPPCGPVVALWWPCGAGIHTYIPPLPCNVLPLDTHIVGTLVEALQGEEPESKVLEELGCAFWLQNVKSLYFSRALAFNSWI